MLSTGDGWSERKKERGCFRKQQDVDNREQEVYLHGIDEVN